MPEPLNFTTQFECNDCVCDCACVSAPVSEVNLLELETGLAEALARPGGLRLAEGVRAEALDPYLALLAPDRPGLVVVDRVAFQQLLDSRRLTQRMSAFAVLLLNLGILTARPAPRLVQALPQAGSVLAAWLHLTDACNLACPYCYVRPVGRQMTPAIAREAVQAAFGSARRHGFSGVKLKFAGGEPSLNFPALQAAQELAEDLSRAGGIALQTVMLTNGARLEEAEIAYLAEQRVGVSLSLDGIGPVHEDQRPLRSGQPGSFERASLAIDRLKSAGISPHISITLTNHNLDGLPELVAYLLEQGLCFSFNFYRPPARDSAALDELAPQPERLVQAMLAAYAAIERNLPSYSLLAGLVDRANLAAPHERACGLGANYLVIDPLGGVAGCQMDLEAPVSHIRADDPLADLQQALRLKNPSVDERACTGCEWRYRCAGGCPRLADITARSPLCEVYRALFPAALRLEALRLVRYTQPVSIIE